MLPENFQKITPQRVLDAAYQAFVIEDKPPAGDCDALGLRCRYLTEDGRKCAIGLLIPDGHPAQKQQTGAYNLSRICPELFETDGVSSVNDLQMALHDNLIQCSADGKNIVWSATAATPALRAARYKMVAKQYGLSLNV